MATTDQLLYLETDDEITSVVRRLRQADAPRVVLVASGRTKSTNSVVALRLLAQVAAEEGREVALVADAAARSLAGEAGIPAFASVADASAEDAVALDPPPSRRAPIHVVRGDPVEPVAATSLGAAAHATGPDSATGAMPAPARSPERDRSAETMAVPLAAAPEPRPRPRPLSWTRRLRSMPRAAFGALIALLLVSGGLLAAVAPSATIVIEPATTEIGPLNYAVVVAEAGADSGQVHATLPGAATGTHSDPSPATGTATFLNWNTVDVEVPAGTPISGGGVQFRTLATIVVDNGQFGLPIDPGEASVAIEAVQPGPDGNVAAEVIDTIDDERVRGFLRGFPNNPSQLVINQQATAGGSLNEQPRITQDDVDRVLTALHSELEQAVADRLVEEPERLYAPLELGEAEVVIADDLVGRIGEPEFELTGSLTYRRPYAERQAAEDAVRDQLLADASVRPDGTEILPDSIAIDLGDASDTGDGLQVGADVSARAARMVDAQAVIELVKGLTAAEAVATLRDRDYGDVSVRLWPDGWVDRVPGLDWRITVEVRDPAEADE